MRGFNELVGVSWANENIFNSDVEYIRKDVAEEMAKEFAIFCYDAGRWEGERDADKLYELFNSRKAKKNKKYEM